MRTIFFTGKGGVGKSTLSAASAWQLAEKGHKVLAVSLDPAHNLGDIFGLKLSSRQKRVNARLYLAEADLEEAAHQYVRRNTDLLTEVYSYTRAFNLDTYFKVLRHAPGVEEYAAVTVLEQIIGSKGDYDLIIFDTPPTALTLRTLALPNITITWIDRLRRIRRDILRKRHTVHNISGKFHEEGTVLPYTEEDDPVMRKLQELFARFVSLYHALKGGDNSIVVVFNPDYLSLRESERIVSGLADLGLPLRAAFDNKYEERLAAEADRVERQLFDGSHRVRLLRVPLQANNGAGSYRMDVDLTPVLLP